MTIEPIARYRCELTSKFGVPRQAGLVPELRGRIVFLPPYRSADALRGLDGFDYLWIIWAFSENLTAPGDDNAPAPFRPLVRPPRLGGNEHMGVWATRSSFRPNGLALSSVRIERIEWESADGPVIHVLGADLMDGTPVFDLKPYVTFTDSHPDARSGFVDDRPKPVLDVTLPDTVAAPPTPLQRQTLVDILHQDPRPSYHDDEQRVYGFPFAGYDVRFRVVRSTAEVLALIPLPQR